MATRIASPRALSSWMLARPVAAVALLMAAAACHKEEIHREAPPGMASTSGNPSAASVSGSAAKGGVCDGGGGLLKDAVSAAFLPQIAGGYCVDPRGEVRTYGDHGKYTMDDVCTTAFDGECEVYKAFDLARVVSLHYVDGSGKGGIVDVILSRFDKQGAYGMFTKRVVADGDPSDPSTPKVLDAGGAGAIGTGRAYVWRGSYLVELQYNNENESPKELKRSSDTILRALAKAIGDKLPLKGKNEDEDQPPSVGALPKEHLVPNGIQFYPKETPEFGRVGASAVAFYNDTVRYRTLAVKRDDEAQAKDVMKMLRARPGTSKIESLGDEAAAVVFEGKDDKPRIEWVVARKGALVMGVGDDEFALRAESIREKRDALRVGRERAVTTVRALLAR